MNSELEPINNEENGIAKLALLLHISVQYAREYYAAVHKYFCNPKPSAFFIAEVIEEDSLVNPKPNLVAKNIAKRLQEYYQRTGHKKSSQMVYVEKKREVISPKSNNSTTISKKVQKIRSYKDFYYGSRIQNDKKLDGKNELNHVYHSKPEPKCPHGVPLYRICPICNPKEYKFWAGDD